MKKEKWIRIVSIYSILYTVITLLSSVLYLCNGIYEDPSGNWLMSGSADCGNLWLKQHTGISGSTLQAFLCCYVSSILSFLFFRKRKGKGKRNDRGCQ